MAWLYNFMIYIYVEVFLYVCKIALAQLFKMLLFHEGLQSVVYSGLQTGLSQDIQLAKLHYHHCRKMFTHCVK